MSSTKNQISEKVEYMQNCVVRVKWFGENLIDEKELLDSMDFLEKHIADIRAILKTKNKGK